MKNQYVVLVAMLISGTVASSTKAAMDSSATSTWHMHWNSEDGIVSQGPGKGPYGAATPQYKLDLSSFRTIYNNACESSDLQALHELAHEITEYLATHEEYSADQKSRFAPLRKAIALRIEAIKRSREACATLELPE